MAGCYIILNFPLEHNRTRCTFLSGKERTGRFGTITGDVELATRSLTETVCKRTLRPLTIRGEVIGGWGVVTWASRRPQKPTLFPKAIKSSPRLMENDVWKGNARQKMILYGKGAFGNLEGPPPCFCLLGMTSYELPTTSYHRPMYPQNLSPCPSITTIIFSQVGASGRPLSKDSDFLRMWVTIDFERSTWRVPNSVGSFLGINKSMRRNPCNAWISDRRNMIGSSWI
jgi:hypothetical protein